MDAMESNSHDMLKRIVAPIAVWAVTKALEAPHVKKTMRRVDNTFYKQRKKAQRSIVRVSRNAAANRIWLAAGLAAIVTGVALMVRSAQKD